MTCGPKRFLGLKVGARLSSRGWQMLDQDLSQKEAFRSALMVKGLKEALKRFFVGVALFFQLPFGSAMLLLDVPLHVDVCPWRNDAGQRLLKNQLFPCWLHRSVAQVWWLFEVGWGKANLICLSLNGRSICSAAPMEGH